MSHGSIDEVSELLDGISVCELSDLNSFNTLALSLTHTVVFSMVTLYSCCSRNGGGIGIVVFRKMARHAEKVADPWSKALTALYRYRRFLEASRDSLSSLSRFLHVTPDRLMRIRSDYNLTGLLQLMAKWMFGNVNWYFLTHYSLGY